MRFRPTQEAEPALNAAVLDNFNTMVGLYARLGVVPGALSAQTHVFWACQ